MNTYSLKKLLSMMTIFVAIGVMASSYLGAMSLSFGNVFDAHSLDYYIFWQVRFPRILAAILVGGALAISGAIMQGLFRNPLVEPGIIGVSSGAALFAALSIVLGNAFFPLYFKQMGDYALPIAACMGGWSVTAILYYFSRNNQGISISGMLLIGIAINAFTGAIIGLLTFIANDAELRSLTFWTLGSLGNFNYSKIAILGAAQLLLIPILLLKTKQMNAMLLGETEAKHIGINVESLKKQQIFGVAILTGSAVAFAGGIGFIGLVVPHLIRLRFGSDHRLLLPLSYLLGGLLLLIADSLARTLAPPTEIPVGIFTAFIGAPFLGYLVLKQSSIR